MTKVAQAWFELSWVGLNGVEWGQVVLGLVELNMYQEGMCWFRLGCDGWVRLS